MSPIFARTLRNCRSSKLKRLSALSDSNVDKPLNWQWCNPPAECIPAEFCLETSLHGLKYIGQQHRHISERLLWLVAFLISVGGAAHLIWTMWQDYVDMPIVTVLNPTEYPLDSIPFPAVTVCNVNNVQKSMFKSIISSAASIIKDHGDKPVIDQTSRQTLATFGDMKRICDSTFPFLDRFVAPNMSLEEYFTETQELMALIDKNNSHASPRETLQKVTQSCDEMILHCIWQEEAQNCSELFKPIETDYGICCTFNAMPLSKLRRHNYQRSHASDNTDELNAEAAGYEKIILTGETRNRKHPYRQQSAGKSGGLSFLVTPDLDEYYCPSTDSEGFMLSLNAPRDFPRMRKHSTSIPTGAEVTVGVQPELTLSEGLLKSYTKERRNCYYRHEFPLRHYTVYTMANCKSECVARNVLEICGCVLYFMPRDRNDTLCRAQQFRCARGVQKNISRTGLSAVCNECLYTCNQLHYHKEVSFLRLHKNRVAKFFQGHNKMLKARDVSIVHVYITTDSLYPKLRKQMMSLTTLISNAGGLLGLFLGFSVLSLLESCYYGTMRICCTSYRKKLLKGLNEGKASSGRRTGVSKWRDSKKVDDQSVFRIRSRELENIRFEDSIEEQFQRAFMSNFQNEGATHRK